jgi:MFS family permease
VEAGPAPRLEAGAWRLLAAVTGLSLLGYVDRLLLVALAPLLIADLGLSRADIGILVGASFIVVFALGTQVVGALADRVSRPGMLAAGLAIWSVTTALTGTASGFWSLVAWRVLVGVGEATLPPVSLSMLGDRFPPGRLGFANGVFYAGIPVGFAVAYALAGWMGPALGWRACFALVGAAGLLAVFPVARMSDPPRRGVAHGSEAAGPRTLPGLARLVAGTPTLLLVVLAATLLVFTSSASQHTITWLVQERGFAFARAAYLSAAFVATAGLVGNLSLGWITDRARQRHPAGRLLSMGALGLAGLGCALAFYLLPPRSAFFLPSWFASQLWMLGWFGPAMAAVDEEAPPGRRGAVIGFGLLTVNLLGVATGPWVVGLVGDRESLTTGLVASLGVGALGIVLLVPAALRKVRPATGRG